MQADERHMGVYKAEVAEHLADLEAALLELDSQARGGGPGRGSGSEIVERIFRSMHTIKGSSSMFGYDEVAALTHEAEALYELIRSGELAATPETVDVSLAVCDQIAMLIRKPPLEGGHSERTAQLVLAIKTFIPGGVGKEHASEKPSAPGVSPVKAGQGDRQRIYRILFTPGPGLVRRAIEPLSLVEEVKSLGRCRVRADLSLVPPLGEMDPEACYGSMEFVLVSAYPEESIRDVFIFVEDESAVVIETLDEGCADDEDCLRIGEILLRRGDIVPSELSCAIGGRKRLGEHMVDLGLVTAAQVDAALREQAELKDGRLRSRRAAEAATVRVPSEKLDTLMDLVGEMVTVQASLARRALGWSDRSLFIDDATELRVAAGELNEVINISQKVDYLVEELRDNAMSLRMLPIGSTFGRLLRLVRDLSRDLGKEVDLVAEGGETELDKTMIERLNDPLVHIIRNCIDHGIESPSARVSAGKPARGTIRMSAESAGGNVIIRINDDGAGLDAATIRAKAIERGLLGATEDLPERELFQMVFMSGFSTAASVTSVSGRGVGMDVVKKNIESMRGSVYIESGRNKGTAITIKLPLTLAIIHGLLVGIASDRFIIPLSEVVECVEMPSGALQDEAGRRLIEVRGEMLPVIDLRSVFSMAGGRPPLQQVVVTGTYGGRAGLVVDEVVGENHTVIKSLGGIYRNIRGVSGATILGDGTVALIADVQQLVADARVKEARRTGSTLI